MGSWAGEKSISQVPPAAQPENLSSIPGTNRGRETQPKATLWLSHRHTDGKVLKLVGAQGAQSEAHRLSVQYFGPFKVENTYELLLGCVFR